MTRRHAKVEVAGGGEVTPNPYFDILVERVATTHDDIFMVSVVMDSPQPVSVNDMYTTFRGKRVLTAAGRTYKDGLSTLVARSSLDWKRAHDMVYQEGRGATLLISLFFPYLLNKRWDPGGRTKTGEPSEPRHVRDAPNYIKVIEDGVAEGCGINDCNNVRTFVDKHEDPQRPRTELVYIVA